MISPKSKYYPLFEYLRQQPDSGLLELSFDEIEEILRQKLPASASSTRAWWANSQTTQGLAWQEDNWLVDYPDFDNGVIIFRPARITYRITPIRKSVGWSGTQVKALRDFAGWSQQELANRLAVRQQTISDWEVGHHTARRSTSKLLQMLAEEGGFPYETNPSKET